MVKIIKQGIDPTKVEHEAQCRSCKTLFSFTVNEAKMNYDWRDGDFLSIDCPVCGTMYTRQARGQ